LEATECRTTEMGEMGKRPVQESKYPILENQIQGTSQPISTLVIGMSIE
jgi:hypothetical protein